MIRAVAVSLALLLPQLAQAQERAPVQLSFSVYAAGLNVLDIQSGVDLRDSGYRVDLSYRTVGLFGLLFHNEIHSNVQGMWAGSGLMPLRFSSWGTLRGQPRRTVIDYLRGQPVVRVLEPAAEADRDPVPAGMQHDTIDALSAMVLMVRQVATTGNCDGHATTFDGQRLVDITSHTIGDEVLENDGRSAFSGLALRCDVEGRQLAGFLHDESDDSLHQVRHNTAWLARLVPGGPKLPVRVMFDTHYFGKGTAYLTEVVLGEAQAAITPLPSRGVVK
jgi:hypothetical protein